jgi:hypothetical protein
VFLESDNYGFRKQKIFSRSQLIGLVFHRAFQIYLTFDSQSSEKSWTAAVVAISEEFNTSITDDEVRRAKLYFLKRVKEVDSLLESFGVARGADLVHAEWSCATTDGRIAGVVDLFIDTEIPVVVDFKTGIDADLEVISPAIGRQLTLYSAIVRDLRGVLPRVFVVGMKTGPREIDGIDVENVLAEVNKLVLEFNSGQRTEVSTVAMDSCIYCRQIGKCTDIWKNAPMASRIGCIQGELAKAPLLARNGLAYISIDIGENELASVRDIPNSFLEGCPTGSKCRVWGLKTVSTEDRAYSWVKNRSQLFVIENS